MAITLTRAPAQSPASWTPGLLERLRWLPARLAMETIGQAADGIRVGRRHGFSSGEMLDYVYENRAGGALGVGAAIDRAFLNTPGWRGIRERRRNLARTLTAIVVARRALGVPTHILDVAAGAGRYLLDVAAALGSEGLTIECRDADAEALAIGRRRAEALGLANVSFVQHDALDPIALAAIRPRPDVVVISGLYEILLDEGAIRASLGGIGELVPSGGLLIVTGQPRHPQAALIRNLLRHRDGSPWAMWPRPTERLEGWCRAAGFRDLQTSLDAQGIFTITVGRR